MALFEILLIATALSLDAFATMSANYSAYEKAGVYGKAMVVMLISFLHAGFALVGYFVSGLFSLTTAGYFKWVVVALFFALAVKCLCEKDCQTTRVIDGKKCLMQSVITSVDAFIGGITLSGESLGIWYICGGIFAVTVVMTTLGLLLGKVLKNGVANYSKYVSCLLFLGLAVKAILEAI